MHWLDSEVAHVSDLTKNYIITMVGFRVTGSTGVSTETLSGIIRKDAPSSASKLVR